MATGADGVGGRGEPSGQTVLIVDDDLTSVQVIAGFLEKNGLAVLSAATGEEGVSAARRARPDLILLDVQMPGIDGYETCRRLKADPALSDVPVLFMSGLAEIEDKMKGFTAGGLDYIAKPFQIRELAARIMTQLQVQEQARSLSRQTEELSRAHEQLELEMRLRTRAEEVLKEAYAALEMRVQERTAALAGANARLQVEIAERRAAERELLEQKAFTDSLIQSSSVAMFVINARNEVVIWNKACEELTGVPAAALLGTTEQWRAFYKQQRPVLADLVLDGAGEAGRGLYGVFSVSVLPAEGLHAEGWYKNLNGRDRYLVFEAAPVRDIAGKVVAAIETLQDFTERKRAEEATAESEERYRTLFDNAEDMVQSTTPDGRFLYVNPAWLGVLGYTPEDLRTLTLFEIVHPSSQAHCREVFSNLGTGKAAEYFAPTLIARDGRLVDVEGSATVILKYGRVASTQAILHNVTERKRLAEISRERMRVTEFERDIGAILNAGENPGEILSSCTAAMVKHLDAAFARIWTLDATGTVLELQASSGLYTHLDGPHGRLSIEKPAKIPRIAKTKKPNLTNQVIGDPGVTEQEWALREGMVSFAGYPLIIRDRVLGVLGMFAKQTLSDYTLDALEFVAGNIALGLERAQSVAALEQYSRELAALNAASNTLMASADLREIYREICEIVVSVFELRLCWLGLVEPGTFEVRPVAHAGREDGYLSTIRVTWDDSPFGRGPTGTAIRTLQPCRAAVDDPLFAPWSVEAQRRGFRASLAVPLVYARDRCLGTLNFYSEHADYFGVDRVKLCQIFANQAAIAIEKARLIEGLEETVAERTSEIEHTNRELQEINRELVLRQAEAQAANQAKSDFLANMSHELRTPLTAIIGFSDLLVRGMAGPLEQTQREYLGDILASGGHLLSLINDILDLSKIEAGRMELEPSEFDLAGLLDQSLVLFREKALKHRIRLGAHVDGSIPAVFGDERKIKQVVFNLLSNAVKFTPDGGAVTIRARALNAEGVDCAQIAITDTGIGIAPADQRLLFQPFKQVAHHLTKQYGGTGLGLSLCKKIVELHQGAIFVESQPGQGSTFTVRIPLRAGGGAA